jgi:hypothetical protein
VAINPPPLGLVTLTSLAMNAYRGMRARREFVTQVRARATAARAQAATRAAAVKGSPKGPPGAGRPS